MLTASLPFKANTLTELHANMLDGWYLGLSPEAFAFACAHHGPCLFSFCRSDAAGQYKLPGDATTELRELLPRIFQVKPRKRITITGLWQDPWFLGDGPEGSLPVRPRGPSLDPAHLELNPMVLKQMAAEGFSGEQKTIASIRGNLCDARSATYHLLCLKRKACEVSGFDPPVPLSCCSCGLNLRSTMDKPLSQRSLPRAFLNC